MEMDEYVGPRSYGRRRISHFSLTWFGSRAKFLYRERVHEPYNYLSVVYEVDDSKGLWFKL